MLQNPNPTSVRTCVGNCIGLQHSLDTTSAKRPERGTLGVTDVRGSNQVQSTAQLFAMRETFGDGWTSHSPPGKSVGSKNARRLL